MSLLNPIALYSFVQGTNPWKVNFVFEKLGLPYSTTYFKSFADVKSPSFLKINPNGRVPAIFDPNTSLTLWESGPILEYLVETYDKDHKISFPAGTPDYWHAKQWLAFQISGQGPYWGQAVWFTLYAPEKVESARVRYFNEVERVIGVLDSWLKDNEYLVGGKCSYVDLAYITWCEKVAEIDPNGDIEMKKYPSYSAWLQRLKERPSVTRSLAERQRAFEAGEEGRRP